MYIPTLYRIFDDKTHCFTFTVHYHKQTPLEQDKPKSCDLNLQNSE